nr:MAG TPA: hypothetical protein [Caudoviricetes sp.]
MTTSFFSFDTVVSTVTVSLVNNYVSSYFF